MRFRRRFLRQLRVVCFHNGLPVMGHTEDIGLGGMSVRAINNLPDGALLRFDIDLDDGAPPVAVQGRVIRIGEGAPQTSFAVEFLEQVPQESRFSVFIDDLELGHQHNVVATRPPSVGPSAQNAPMASIPSPAQAFPEPVSQAQGPPPIPPPQRRAVRQKALVQERETLSRRCETLRQELTVAQQSLLREQQQQQQVMTQNQQLERRLADRQHEQMSVSVRASVEALRRECDRLVRANTLLEARCEEMTRENESLKRDRSGAAGGYPSGPRARHRLLAQRQEMMAVEGQREVDHLKQQVNELRAALERQSQESNRQRLEGQYRQEVVDAEHEYLKDLISRRDKELERLQDENRLLGQVRQQLVDALDSLQERARMLDRYARELKTNLTNAEMRVQLKDSVIDQLQQELEASNQSPVLSTPPPTAVPAYAAPAPANEPVMDSSLPAAVAPAYTEDWSLPEEIAQPAESDPPEALSEDGRRWTGSANPSDLQYFGFGRRLSYWLERVLVRIAPGRVDLDEMPDWSESERDF